MDGGRTLWQHGAAAADPAATTTSSFETNPAAAAAAATTPRIDFDGGLATRQPTRAPAGRRVLVAPRTLSSGSTLLSWCYAAPIMLCYVALVIANLMSVTITDSHGSPHSVRLLVTANFMSPWKIFYAMSLWCFCPAHYWLTLYDATRAVEWNRHGNARETVEHVATAVERFTWLEAVHWSIALFPVYVAAGAGYYHNGVILTPVVATVESAIFLGGQIFWQFWSHPRGTIVRFRGPATANFAWQAMKANLFVALVVLVCAVHPIRFWLDEPILLPVDPPNCNGSAGVGVGPDCSDTIHPHPAGLGDLYFLDYWRYVKCPGLASGDPAEPWLVNLTGCKYDRFNTGERLFNIRNDSLKSTAGCSGKECPTLPSMWRGVPQRRYFYPWSAVIMGPQGFFCYQLFISMGTFSGAKDLRFEWGDILAGAVLLGWLVSTLVMVMLYLGDAKDSELEWALAAFRDVSMIILFWMSYFIMRKDSVAELARARATHASRWKISGQYAAFLSHYKHEAASDARQIKEKLVGTLGAPVFLDSDDLHDLRDLCHQVAMSDVLVLFQTRNLLMRPW